LEEVKKYIDENGKRPSHYKNNKNKNEILLSNWLTRQIINYKIKKQIMLNKHIYLKWEEFINDDKYKECFMSNEDNWNNNLQKVKEYINKYKKLPSHTDKNNNIRSIGYWISDQKKNFYNRKCIMKNKNIIKQWEEFINSNEYKQYFLTNEEEWENNLKGVKKYIDKYKKKPNHNNKDKNISTLANWISTQKNNHNNNEYIMNYNKNIRYKWEEFINDSKYKEHFLTNEEDWGNKLDFNNSTPTKLNITSERG
jgi:hypothetical protein